MKKTKKIFYFLTAAVLLAGAAAAGALFAPKKHEGAYTLSVAKGQSLAAVARRLADDGIVYSAAAFQAAARLTGLDARLRSGNYPVAGETSAWDLAVRLRVQRPQGTKVRIIEGMTFKQMRQAVNENPNLQHDTLNLSDEALLKKIAPDAPSGLPEGLFFPDSYSADAGSSDVQIFQAAYKKMQQHLNKAWQNRENGLPYKNPYELLIMASIVEKETGHPDDRRHVAAVFRNRLHKNMRLQTDPTVIYGMGEAYQGNIRRADLERDTPYNTYTRAGLTPTPIALPGLAALEAAAKPSEADYLYFVAKMDGTGKSQFSRTLDEHNAAVRKYILKQ